MPKSGSQDDQDRQGQNDDEELDEDQDSDGSQDDSDSDSDDQKGDSEGLATLTPAELVAEIRKLRRENARRRTRERDARKEAQEAAKKKQADLASDERATLAEKKAEELAKKLQENNVSMAIRDVLADKYPGYLKLARRIAPFVELEEDADEEAIREAVEEAVESFVKEVPIKTDASGTPVGGIGRGPSRTSQSDTSQPERLKKMFPGIYSNR
jgi:hypothetical protein